MQTFWSNGKYVEIEYNEWDGLLIARTDRITLTAVVNEDDDVHYVAYRLLRGVIKLMNSMGWMSAEDCYTIRHHVDTAYQTWRNEWSSY